MYEFNITHQNIHISNADIFTARDYVYDFISSKSKQSFILAFDEENIAYLCDDMLIHGVA